jgi:hypothetical protein
MAIDFPASPTLNDVFTVGNVTYVWDGTKWTASVTGGISLDKIEEGNTSAEVIDTGSDGRFVVTTEGTERLRVTDTGRVGIGTASPNGNTNYGSLDLNGSAGGEIFFSSGGVSRGNIFNYSATPANLGIAATDASGQIIFNTGGYTERVRIDSSGRLGIGTSSPGAAIHVTSSNAGGYGGVIYNTSSTGEGLIIRAGSTSSHNILVAQTYDGSASRFIVNAAGNVGINTTSPAWPLDVNGIAKVKQAVLFEAANSTNRWDLYTNTDDTFRFNYNGAGNDEITITSGGNVGIGAPPASWDPDAGLSAIQLNGYGAIWNYYNNVQLAFNTYQSSTGDKYLTAGKAAKYTLDSGGDHVWYTAGSGSANAAATFGERARIDNSGRLLVGTSSASGSARAVFQGNNFSSGQPSIVYFQRDSSSSGLTAGAAITYLPFADNAGGIYGQIACLVDGVAGTNDYPGRLTFSTTPDGASSPTERMRITNSGYTIHHASGWVLEVATAAASGTTDRLIYGVSERAAAGAGGGNQVFIVYSNGNVVNFNNSYGSISDIKLKENIVDAHSQWDDLKALQVRNYNFKEGQTHTQIGLVALQEAMERSKPLKAWLPLTTSQLMNSNINSLP